MTAAWGKQRARVLQEQGTVTALAVNDPKRLNEVFQPPPGESSGTDGDGFVDWDSEE